MSNDLEKQFNEASKSGITIAGGEGSSNPASLESEFAALTGGVVPGGVNTPMAPEDWFSRGIANTPRQVFGTVKTLVTQNPLDTAMALSDLIKNSVVGGGKNLVGRVVPGVQANPQEQTSIDAINGMVYPYAQLLQGNTDPYKEYVSQGLLYPAADASILLSGGGSLLNRAPGLLAKAGEATKWAGANLLEPVQATENAVKLVSALPSWAAKETWGRLTGQGSGTINQAIKSGGGANLTDFMRGVKTPEVFVDEANSGIGQVHQEMMDTYRTRLAAIEAKQPLTASIDPLTGMPSYKPRMIDVTPIEDAMDKLMDQYHISRDPALVNDVDNPLGLNFHGSGIPGAPTKKGEAITGEANEIKDAIETIVYFPDHSMMGLDRMKKAMKDFLVQGGVSRGFVGGMYDAIRSTLNKDPVLGAEYMEMTKDYDEVTNFLRELNHSLNLGGKRSADQTLQRFQTIMKDNYTFRKNMLEKLDQASGGDLLTKLAGLNLSSWTPTGFRGAAIDTAAVLDPLLGGNPKVALLPALASPRVVGEFLNFMGQAARNYRALKAITPTPVRQAATEASRIPVQPQPYQEASQPTQYNY